MREKYWHGCERNAGDVSSSPEQGEACGLAEVARAWQAKPLSARIHTRAYGENIGCWWYRGVNEVLDLLLSVLRMCSKAWLAVRQSFSRTTKIIILFSAGPKLRYPTVWQCMLKVLDCVVFLADMLTRVLKCAHPCACNQKVVVTTTTALSCGNGSR